MNEAVTLLVLALSTWRISNLLMFEDGPFRVIAKLRVLLGVKEAYDPSKIWTGFISELFSCMYCFSVWVGILVAVLTGHTVLMGLGLSAAAILIENFLSTESHEHVV